MYWAFSFNDNAGSIAWHVGFDYWGTNHKRRDIKCDYYTGWGFGGTRFGHWVIKDSGYA